ncbi:hypothetical protein PANDA_004206, partial [Ailuropoda melanoleuca]
MSPLRLQASLSLLLLLLLGGCLLVAARRDKGAAGSAAEPASGPAGGSSGRFVSPERHACSWQLVLGGLRKKRRPCQDPAPLKARLCAGKKGHGAELRLVPQGSSPVRPTAAGFPRDPEPQARSRERLREPAPAPAGGARLPASKSPRGKPSEKTKAGKRKVASDPEEERPLGTGPDPDGLDENAKLTETYCAEKWHSLCNFFVNFWNG